MNITERLAQSIDRDIVDGLPKDVSADCKGAGHGFPNRAHRNKALRNAVVPQIPEMIGRAIMAGEAGQ